MTDLFPPTPTAEEDAMNCETCCIRPATVRSVLAGSDGLVVFDLCVECAKCDVGPPAADVTEQRVAVVGGPYAGQGSDAPGAPTDEARCIHGRVTGFGPYCSGECPGADLAET